jgi:hypothetical protein
VLGLSALQQKKDEIKELVRQRIGYRLAAAAGTFGEITSNFSEDFYKKSRKLGADCGCIMWEN